MVRLIATFTVYDRFEGKLDNLINFAALIKSPSDLPGAWLKAVTRSKAPVSFKQLNERYWAALQ